MALENVLRDMGVVGAGGAGFPTHIKVANKYDVVIGNGAECEPLLYNDKYIIERQGEEVVKGLELVMQSTGAKRGNCPEKRPIYCGKYKKL
jgi:Predicted NADH:ubiquinone oxidoreductase, subunit RnfC